MRAPFYGCPTKLYDAPVSAPTVVILAAGEGTRMRSRTPKVLHELCGRPLILWPVLAALEAGAAKVVVVDNPKRRLAEVLPEGVELAVQEQPRGTGDAVRAAAHHVDRDAPVVILMGDVPLIAAETIVALVEAHRDAGATVATMELEDPAQYGRIVRAADGSVERIVETKAAGDATPEQLAIREVNTGVYAFAGGALLDALERIEPANAQGEHYLPDALPLLRGDGLEVRAHLVEDVALTLGVNDRVDLATIRALAQQRIHDEHARAGVTIVDPASTLIEVGVAIGQDTVIEPSSFLRGRTRVGEGCVVGPLTTLIDSELGDGVTVPHSYLTGTRAADGVSVGPFAYLRPGAVLEARAKAGTFVEIKNANIGEGSKVPHLSYIGDADVGPGTNLGAGNITANYDGVRKHRTTIGANVRTGVDTMFVAPVTVGDGALTGAGSTITEDIPPGALGIARERQRNVEGFAERERGG